ncbi:MAG: DivIVA domain-containing protein [Microthrixaceae bacterium]
MTDALPEPPDLDPQALAASEFTKARRGLEPTEVRAVMGRAADALRAWQERDARLRARVDELEQRLDESHEMDEQRIATVLGEETARIVTAARDAAAEIRSKAEEQAAQLLRETEEQASAAADALRSEAQTLRDEAAQLHSEAVAATSQLREAAATDAARTRELADTETAAMREEAAALATATVSDAQARSDELRAAAESVLAERTAEADAAAAEITEAARVHRSEVEEAAAALRAEAEAETTELRERTAADVASAREEAEQEAAALIEDAQERGRAMVAEAREVRERMLRDLAERRRVARRQIEGALAGRDRIVEVLRAAGEEVGHTIAELDQVDEAASLAADEAAASIDAALDDEVEALRAELQPDPEDIAAPAAPAEPMSSTEPARLTEVPALEVVEVQVTEVVVGMEVRDDLDDDMVDDLDEDDDELDEDEMDVHDPADEADAELGDQDDGAGATVHDLFARIRAEGLDEGAQDGSAEDDESGEPALDGTDTDTDACDEPAALDDATAIDVTDAATEAGDPAALVDSEEQLFDRRDQVLVPVEKSLSRGLKRLASDEQNEILDRLRRVKRGRPDPAEILPDPGEDRYVAALSAEFANAVRAGVGFWADVAGVDTPTEVDADDDELRTALAARVTGFLALHRAHLERTFAEAEEAGLDASETGDRVRAAYRDWRSGSLSDLAGDLATAGFALGERRAAGPGTPWRWVVDHGGLPCADGEDNALAGAVACDEPFPTGDVTPPAHPGCRCMLAPARQ